MGSLVDVAQRLALWAGRAPQGLARVEYSSEFSRQWVLGELGRLLGGDGRVVREVVLPRQRDPGEVVAYLLEVLQGGRYGEAEPLVLQALQIRRSQLGEDHPNTQTVLKNFQLFLQQVVKEGRTGELSDHPTTQEGLARLQT